MCYLKIYPASVECQLRARPVAQRGERADQDAGAGVVPGPPVLSGRCRDLVFPCPGG